MSFGSEDLPSFLMGSPNNLSDLMAEFARGGAPLGQTAQEAPVKAHLWFHVQLAIHMVSERRDAGMLLGFGLPI